MVGYEGGLVSLQNYGGADPVILNGEQIRALSAKASELVARIQKKKPVCLQLGSGVCMYWHNDGHTGIHIMAPTGEGIYILPRQWDELMLNMRLYTRRFFQFPMGSGCH